MTRLLKKAEKLPVKLTTASAPIPWRAVGIAAVGGLLLGLLVARK